MRLPEQKQNQIFMAAFKVFSQKGYFQSAVADICKEAGISNGALYKYFANKESLYLSCIDFGIELMAKDIFATGLELHDTYCNKIRHLLKKTIEFSIDYGHVVSVYLDLGSVSYNKFAGMVSEKIEKRAQNFHIQLIREAMDKGEIDPAVDPDSAAYIIDNHITMLAFSMVSTHYQKRFQAYFGERFPELDNEKKIDIIMKSIGKMLETPH